MLPSRRCHFLWNLNLGLSAEPDLPLGRENPFAPLWTMTVSGFEAYVFTP